MSAIPPRWWVPIDGCCCSPSGPRFWTSADVDMGQEYSPTSPNLCVDLVNHDGKVLRRPCPAESYSPGGSRTFGGDASVSSHSWGPAPPWSSEAALVNTLTFPGRLGIGIPPPSSPIHCSFHPDMTGTSADVEVPTLRQYYTTLPTASMTSTPIYFVMATNASLTLFFLPAGCPSPTTLVQILLFFVLHFLSVFLFVLFFSFLFLTGRLSPPCFSASPH